MKDKVGRAQYNGSQLYNYTRWSGILCLLNELSD
mgnify:CR=1 FL=1